MKVILLAPTPPPMGGIAKWTNRMMEAELENGWEVEIVDEKIIGNREFFGDKIKHDWCAEIKRCFKIWKNLVRALKDKDAKVVHACVPANTMPVLRECISALITKVCRRKFIIHFRCTVPNMVKGGMNRFAVKCLCMLSNCVILLNKSSVDYIESLCKTKVELIPNFVESTEIETKKEIRETIKRVLYVGGVIKSKGCVELIEAAKAFPEIEFRLVGSVSSDIVMQAEMVDNVRLLGNKDAEQVRKELSAADVFVFLTYFPGEGFSNALVEAMAYGLPCIVTDWAANKDMIEEYGGFVIPIKSSEEVIKALNKMMSVEVRKAQSEYNINKVKTAYADYIILRQYVSCYDECIMRKKDGYVG